MASSQQAGTEIFEGGRYKIVTDGSTNSVYFCIRKCKASDEGKYSITAYNCHGEDTVSMSLLVAPEGGMDFRAMLQHRQYGKWNKQKPDPDWQLKEREKEEELAKLAKKVRHLGYACKGFLLVFLCQTFRLCAGSTHCIK